MLLACEEILRLYPTDEDWRAAVKAQLGYNVQYLRSETFVTNELNHWSEDLRQIIREATKRDWPRWRLHDSRHSRGGGVRATLRFRVAARLAPVVGVATHAYQSEGAAFASAPSSSEDSTLKGSSRRGSGLFMFRALGRRARTAELITYCRAGTPSYTDYLRSSPVLFFIVS
jgi:hypothetical protein